MDSRAAERSAKTRRRMRFLAASRRPTISPPFSLSWRKKRSKMRRTRAKASWRRWAASELETVWVWRPKKKRFCRRMTSVQRIWRWHHPSSAPARKQPLRAAAVPRPFAAAESPVPAAWCAAVAPSRRRESRNRRRNPLPSLLRSCRRMRIESTNERRISRRKTWRKA